MHALLGTFLVFLSAIVAAGVLIAVHRFVRHANAKALHGDTRLREITGDTGELAESVRGAWHDPDQMRLLGRKIADVEVSDASVWSDRQVFLVDMKGQTHFWSTAGSDDQAQAMVEDLKQRLHLHQPDKPDRES